MASYVEPTTNKGSFRFGSQFHLLKDATTTQTKGLIPAAFRGEGVVGEGEQLAQPVGRRVGVQLPAGVCGREWGWDILLGGSLWEKTL